jgi:hypothetical protein
MTVAANDEIARDLTLAVIQAVGVIDTSGNRQAINQHRAREVGNMYALIYRAVCTAKQEGTADPTAAA